MKKTTGEKKVGFYLVIAAALLSLVSLLVYRTESAWNGIWVICNSGYCSSNGNGRSENCRSKGTD